ncbi:GNAT family N-acetyltransferase [Alteribacter natronophilus]|uniref:GNAT family N-acetyltransferase n=1 Tax=Alteribacter natronophilus TaxID=2583810 RepID=UPI00110DEBB4|nr:GNAT family N-acetyltransferase [Alteribacter natronophilus]TMW73663.1 GNAT family N-acetyltransferase [Alteribacter natronophilus]
MIIPYQQDYKKIAMGLLSYMPGEKKVKKLQNTMDQYSGNRDWELYFWKEEDTFVGIMGVEMDGERAYLHHLCVNPSFRSEGIGKRMVRELESHLGTTALCPTKPTTSFLDSCNESGNERKEG